MKKAARKITAFAAAICIAASSAAATAQTAIPFFGSIGTCISASAGGNIYYNKTFDNFVSTNIRADMSVTEKLDAICNFLCVIGTTPETADLPIYTLKVGSMGEQRYDPDLYWSHDFFELAQHMAYLSEIETRAVSLNGDGEEALVYILDGKTHAIELHVDENGVRSCTDRVLTGNELFTYDRSGSVCGYIGDTPENGVLTLPTVSPTGMTVYNVSFLETYFGADIREVIIPEGITSISDFISHSAEKIDIPASVTCISENNALWICDNLKEINIAPENKNYTFKNNVLYCNSGSKHTALFAIKGKNIVLDKSTTRIAYFFNYETETYSSSELYKLTIPGKVNELVNSCITTNKISEIVIEEGNLGYIFSNTFECSNLTDVTIPANVVYVSDSAFGDTYFTVHGAPDSAAEWFANNTGRPFVAIEQEEKAPVDPAKTDLSEAELSFETKFDYNGSEHKPKAEVKLGEKTLTEGTDYTISYKNNTDAGTATLTVKGAGEYTGSVKGNFEIKAAKLNKDCFRLAKKAYMKDDGTEVGAKLKVYSPVTGERLTEGTDYVIKSQYTDFFTGTTKFRVKGKGNFSGTFDLGAKARASVAYADVNVNGGSFSYSGYNKTPSVSVVLNGKTLTDGTDYTVNYYNNYYTGKADITITGIGKYSGMTETYFSIRPQKTTIKNVTSPYSGQVKVSWKRLSTSDGYKVMIADNADFYGAQTYYNGSYLKTSRTIKGLTPGKTYYVKTAAYKTIDGRKYFGKTSDVWSVYCW